MTTSSTLENGRIDVRRAEDRFRTALPWLESHHSFSLSRHYGRLDAGDAVRLTAAGAPRLPADDAGAEVLIWELGG